MTDKQPATHTEYGCTCAVCTKWRQDIYNIGRWPRPRLYNGEVPASKTREQA